MVAGRRVALTAVGLAGLLALLDVRPPSATSAPRPLRPQLTDQVGGGSSDRPVATQRDAPGARRPGAAQPRVAAVDVPSTARDTAAPGPDHDLVLIGAGDGHRFGYARGITAAPVERPSPERTALTTGTASGPRASGRATGWSWRPGESTGGGGVSHRSSGDDALAIARAATAPALEAGDDGRSLRITQTFAYLHGATGSASTTETPTGGFEVPTGTEPETDLGEGQDTGTALDPVRRRATGGGGGRGHGEAPRGGSGRNPPSRAGTR